MSMQAFQTHHKTPIATSMLPPLKASLWTFTSGCMVRQLEKVPIQKPYNLLSLRLKLTDERPLQLLAVAIDRVHPDGMDFLANESTTSASRLAKKASASPAAIKLARSP